MKTATALHFLSALLLTLTLTACGLAPAQAQDPFLGTFRIDLPGKSNLTTEVRDVGNHQQESRTTLTPGSAASNVGQLEIKADGTYRISGYLGLGGTRTGRWIANDEGPFSDKGGIELLEVKSANYDADQRSWFVYLENGQLVGREPPYSGFNHLLFTRLGTAPSSAASTRPAAPQQQRPGSANTPTPNRPVASKPAARELTQNDVFALNNDITVYLTGKTQSELESLLGKALSRDDPDGYSQEFSLQSATLPLANYPGPYTRASVQFDAPPALGGKVKYVTLR